MAIDAGALRLLEMLEAQMDTLAERIAERIQSSGVDAEGPGYASLPREELRLAVAGNFRLAFEAIREQRPPSQDELELSAAVGELRARDGFPLETVQRAYRMAGHETLELAERLAPEADVNTQAGMALAGALWAWIDEVSVVVARAHRGVELALARRDQQQRGAFVHGLMFGSLSPQKLADGAATYGLEPTAGYHALRVRPTAEHDLEELERLLAAPQRLPRLVSVVDGDLAGVLPSPPAADIPVAAGLGPPVPLDAIGHSFALASRALETAIAFGREGLHRLEDLSIRPSVVSDDQVGQILHQRYIAPVRAVGAPGDELLRSVRAYLSCDLSVDKAAHALPTHPNTLRKRLTRFEETTGASLHNAEQLVEIWWALEREELGGERGVAAETDH